MTISKQKTIIQHIHDLGWWTISFCLSIVCSFIRPFARVSIKIPKLPQICFMYTHVKPTDNSYLISHDSKTKTQPYIFDERQWWSVRKRKREWNVQFLCAAINELWCSTVCFMFSGSACMYVNHIMFLLATNRTSNSIQFDSIQFNLIHFINLKPSDYEMQR